MLRLVRWYVGLAFFVGILILVTAMMSKHQAYGMEPEQSLLPLCVLLHDGQSWSYTGRVENTEYVYTEEYTSQRGQKLRTVFYREKPIYALMDVDANGLYEVHIYGEEIITYCSGLFTKKG